MKRSQLALFAALAVGVFALAWVIVSAVRDTGPTSTASARDAQVTPSAIPTPAARTSLPGVTASSGEPTLASLQDARPAAGRAVQASGPFDDRFTMTGLRFDGRAVHAQATVTTDVSDILEFVALAGFYDQKGALIGTNRFTYHLDETHAQTHTGPPSEVRAFTIAVPTPLRGRAVSAAVGVPVLVNE